MPNRLSDAISPYLRSHADNPVDWYPWGDEAFAEAARRDVPILLSIGYSTCHWCHVMARESFSDPEVAILLSGSVVAVKVDREEHPEVDTTYLAAASAFTQNLGWPLNVLITPQGQAFYAFTYLPPQPLPGRPSFSQVIGALTEVWNGRRDDVEVNAAKVTAALRASTPSGGSELPGPTELASLAEAAIEQADPRFGGLGVAPKFPNAPLLAHLLASGVPTAVDFAERTLAAMAASELRDPVEGGFFRYAVQQDWTEPHYERMLYDNAGLLDAYITLWASDRAAHGWALEVAEGIAGYLTGILLLPHGGFASAQDSESELDGVRSEGGYYRLDAAGRAAVPTPALDGKVLTGWNGLAIGALASAGTLARRPEWVAAARSAADYQLDTQIDQSGTLHRVSVDGAVSRAVATLEDYGMLAAGLVELSLACGEPRYAELAATLVDACQGEREDTAPVPPGGSDPLLSRFGLALPVDASEGAYPSGPSAYARAALGLHRLGAVPSVQGRDYRTIAARALAPLGSVVRQNPAAYGAALDVLAGLACSSTELVVVVGHEASGEAAALVDAAISLPADLLAIVDESEADRFAAAGFTLFEGRGAGGHDARAYLCSDGVCRLPVSDPSQLAEAVRAR